MAVRNRDDNDDDDRPRKKKPRPAADDDDDDDRPRKKRSSREDDDDDDRPRKKRSSRDDDEDDHPRRKRARKDDDEDDDDEDDLADSPLAAIVPLGGSMFALAALWLSALAAVLTVASAVFFLKSIVSCILPIPWLFALVCGVLAFFTHKHKKSYGSITGNMRAVIGIVISLGVMIAHGYLIYLFANSK